MAAGEVGGGDTEGGERRLTTNLTTNARKEHGNELGKGKQAVWGRVRDYPQIACIDHGCP